ncbi:WD40-repeat-containing domain protein [Diplogelasinospora grovesii]|uniref:WD40-repeat-containing domain protein n=1 Tax=Diplogelasinospora grovesii TaxID=303347 RepID=A0AAN6S785_9PEZI|nr:WD40-repeat-containing domain protein [Diplogelasinospora grovesii]
MGHKMDANGETAALKKRKREPKDVAPLTPKRQRSKSQSKPKNGTPKDATEPKDKPTPASTAPVQPAAGDLVPTESSALLEARESSSTWKVSNPMGGRMLDIDPIFSPDERHLVITYNTSIQVYGTNDSLLVRRIPLPVTRWESGKESTTAYIVASALSKTAPEYVWVACSDGRVWHINWTTGEGAETPHTIEAKKILDMTVEAVEFSKSTQDVLFVLQKLTKASGQIVAYNSEALSTKNGKLVHTYHESPQMLRTAAGGRLIVAAARETVQIGLRTKKARSFNDLEFRFHSFGVADLITSLDIRALTRRNKDGSVEIESANLALGCSHGAIFEYTDILSKLPKVGATPATPSKAGYIHPRKHHWHRRAVHSVKYSEDGNYLVSGGAETVLVLWQLDTGHRDFLPHLSATIENIVVSPRGSSYALHLDDNSAMILSTAEMKPTMYVSGIQSLVLGDRHSKEFLVRREKSSGEISTPLVAASNPTNPAQIFLCVGSGQQAATVGDEVSTPLLQVFDTASFQGVSKHAIARTNATEANITTQGVPIIEPRVTKLAFSHDGKWLASVDEWEPPESDVVPFLTGSKTVEEACRERREIYLKFWEVGSEDTPPQLVSRITEAHHTDKPETIFDVASDPTSSRFASIGNDGVVRFWTSKLRKRDGLAATGPEGQQLRAWTCSRAVALPVCGQDDALEDSTNEDSRSGAIAFSEDGSVLFAAYGAPSEAAVVAIDTETGTLRDIVSGMFRGEVRAIKSLGSCLLMLSDDLTVYDIVADELLYSFSLKETSEAAKRLTQLAVNYTSRTFALVAPIPTNDQRLRRGAKSELLVFSVEDGEPQMVHTFPQLITSVLPAAGSSGFVLVDSAAQIWSVTEGAEQGPLLQPLVDTNMDGDVPEAEAAPMDLAVVEDEGDASDAEMQDADREDEDMEDLDIHPAVVAPQRLAEIFNAAPAFAMPPIEDIFYQVAGLFSAKPLQAQN